MLSTLSYFVSYILKTLLTLGLFFRIIFISYSCFLYHSILNLFELAFVFLARFFNSYDDL